MTPNLSLKWWRATGTTTPEVVLVSLLPSPVARLVLGPESLWRPVSEFDAAGEWFGEVKHPELPTPAQTTSGEEVAEEEQEQEQDPVVVGTVSAPAKQTFVVVDEAVAASETARLDTGSDSCPPEIEAMLGKDKDTMVAAQFNVPVALVAEWRKSRGITRFRTKPEPSPEAPSEVVEATPEAPPIEDVALANLITSRFAEGASDEDMAQEAGLSVAKVVEARRKLGLQRPRGRKPGVPQGPRKPATPEVVEATPEVVTPEAPSEATPEVVTPEVVDPDLDGLLDEAV
jgi:hypothetical protein